MSRGFNSSPPTSPSAVNCIAPLSRHDDYILMVISGNNVKSKVIKWNIISLGDQISCYTNMNLVPITSLLLSSQDFPTFLTGQPDSVQCCKTFDEPGAEVGIIFQTIAVCLPPCLHRSHAFGLPMKNPDYPRFILIGCPVLFRHKNVFMTSSHLARLPWHRSIKMARPIQWGDNLIFQGQSKALLCPWKGGC